MGRNHLLTSGLLGLTGALLLTATAITVMLQGWLPALLQPPLWVGGLFAFLLFFSLLEIPMMIFAMRKMADSPAPKAKHMVWLTNTAFTFFAAVYALPFILLAGDSPLTLGAGVALAALAIIRFISAMVYIPHD